MRTYICVCVCVQRREEEGAGVSRARLCVCVRPRNFNPGDKEERAREKEAIEPFHCALAAFGPLLLRARALGDDDESLLLLYLHSPR